MLKFKTIRYKNFLATGNAWNSYAFDQHNHTLIVGANGAGKTTVLDAVCFALYGKPFRNINKPQLCNSINQKELVVEIEFETQNNTYLIRRGMKPTVFEIFCNGVRIPEFPSAAEMADYLEKYILKCSYKSFTAVVILGASSYVPFMRLTPQARRDIIENLLDVEVFSMMHALLKGRLADTKDALQLAQSHLAVVESQHALAKTYTEQWTQQQQRKRDTIETSLATVAQNVEHLTEQHTRITAEMSQWSAAADKLAGLQEKHTKASKLVTKFATQCQHLQQSKEFFHDHDQCPTCTQILSEEFKTTQVTTVDAQLQELTTKWKETREIVARLAAKIERAKAAQKEARRLENERHQINERLNSYQRETTRLTEEREHTFAPPPPPPTDLGSVEDAQAAVDAQNYQKHVLEQGHALLKDNGIRTKIIQHYLPVINKWVNYYLSALDFPIQFTLDDQFNETIKSRYRDVFSYENFSEGEKKRIDLALVLTWRAVARMKNSVYCNILIFDEVFDSSLDISGTEDFLRLLHTLDKDTNVFVISHKTDAMIDKFSHVVSVSKERGFSVVKSL
jgi:DNA repair exonuclease SbcCD ATPase subunit